MSGAGRPCRVRPGLIPKEVEHRPGLIPKQAYLNLGLISKQVWSRQALITKHPKHVPGRLHEQPETS